MRTNNHQPQPCAIAQIPPEPGILQATLSNDDRAHSARLYDQNGSDLAAIITHSLGKPSHAEDRHNRLSLYVDRLPALFANTVEYPGLRARIHKDGRRICRVGEPVIMLPHFIGSSHDN